MTARVVGWSVWLVFLVSALLQAQERRSTSQRPLAFTHVAVIDATGRPLQPDMTVVVSGDHITALGKANEVKIPVNALVTNASGKFMIPGLWDMHSHVFMRKNKMLTLLTLYLFIANGVTGVRDMGDQGTPDDFGDFPYIQDFEWRQAIKAGVILGPHLLLPGVIVDGPGSPRRGWVSVANAEQARQEVIFLRSLGADFIKVYDHEPREAYLAIADETEKQGMTFAGHVPLAVSAGEASDAGQRSEEHLYQVLFGCTTRERELMQKVTSGDPMRGILDNVQILADSYSDEKATSLFARFVRNKTYQTPTLIRLAGVIDPVPLTDPRVVKYFSPALRAEYVQRINTNKPEDLPAERLLYQIETRIVGSMNRSGVKLLAGTDNFFYGTGLHDELGLLVKAGLTPMQALQTATRNAAEFLGMLDTTGTIEKGKQADLVLLEANPLQDIGNTRQISAVVVNGSLLDRNALERLLAQVDIAAHGK